MSRLRFTGAATRWLESLPLGDGRLGVMTNGGVATTLLDINDGAAWSGSPSSELQGRAVDSEASAALLEQARTAIAAGDPIGAEAPLKAMQTRYAQAYLPLGRVIVHIGDEHDDPTLTRELDLTTGIHRSRTAVMRTTTFVSAAHSVLVHIVDSALPVRLELTSQLRRLSAQAPEITADVESESLLLRLPSDVAPGHEPDLPAAVWSDMPGDALEAALCTRVIREEQRSIVLVATATTFTSPGAEPAGDAHDARDWAVARLDAASADGADALLADSEVLMRSLLGGVSLAFGEDTHADLDTDIRLSLARQNPRGALAADPGLAALLFDYGRYLLASCSRPGGLPSPLQGLWNDDMRPPWSGGYTLNINTEMNYWGAHVTNLSSCAEPLTEFTLALAKAAPAQTSRLYGAPGWTVHHNTDPWLYATAPGRGKGDPRWAFWPMGGAWIASALVDAWDFGAADADDLARIWPALRGAAEFALAWHRDGRTSPATSPENAYLLDDGRIASLAETSAMDLAVIRGLFERVARVADAIGTVEDAVVVDARERLAELPEQPSVAPDGALIEWDAPRRYEDPHHRHVSGLFGLFPGAERWSADRLASAATTLERRGDDSSGWSLVWKMALWARLGRPDKVASLIDLSLRDADLGRGEWSGGLYPNLFAAHPPFQIDGNLGYVGALSEALLQSHVDIHLLPAVPDALATGHVTGLVARPGILVDIRWQDGQLVHARLCARHPRFAGTHRVHWNDRTIEVVLDAEHALELDANHFDTPKDHL